MPQSASPAVPHIPWVPTWASALWTATHSDSNTAPIAQVEPTSSRRTHGADRGGHASDGLETDGAQRPAAAPDFETQPRSRVNGDEAKAPGPLRTICTEPLTWAISCILPFSTDQHYTPHTAQGHFTALFTQGCLSVYPLLFTQEHFTHNTNFQPSWLIKALLIQLRARIC